MSALTLDWATLRSLAGMTDDIGILSIYASLDPQRRTEPQSRPAWEVRVRQELSRVRDEARRQRPRDEWRALEERLETLQMALDDLLDPASPGQGQALFAAVRSGETRRFSLQVPLVDRVVLRLRPYLRPLLTAWSTAGPAGAVSVCAEEVRAVDLRFGLAENVAVFPYLGSVEQSELKGPATSLPGMAQHSAKHRDLYERRELDKLLRFLRSLGPRLIDLAKQREWGFLVVTGQADLAFPMAEALPTRNGLSVLTLEHPVNHLSPAQVAEVAAPTLAQARQRHHRALAEQARDAAFAGGNGAYGLSETLAALQQGQVAHLLLDADGQWYGRATADGVLAPDGEVPPGVDPSRLRPEPDLGERMIEYAFRDSADITLLTGEAAAPLSDAGGVGALLRW